MTRDGAPHDLIAEYLDRLRRGLRVRAGEAELILAEAEDHLRETEAAGLAVGMTEREAQEAAISSFGPVRAVTRAHLARAAGGPAAAVMAAWKLISLLLLAAGASGMAIVVFGAITLALGVFELRTQSGVSGHVLPVFAVCLAVTLGYAVRLGQVLLRQR
jgi:hypothetical protein